MRRLRRSQKAHGTRRGACTGARCGVFGRRRKPDFIAHCAALDLCPVPRWQLAVLVWQSERKEPNTCELDPVLRCVQYGTVGQSWFCMAGTLGTFVRLLIYSL